MVEKVRNENLAHEHMEEIKILFRKSMDLLTSNYNNNKNNNNNNNINNDRLIGLVVSMSDY